MTLLDGSFIFLAFVVLMLVALVLSTYTRTGSGISQRPYDRRYGDAPGAKGASAISGRDGLAAMSSRGTR